MGASGTPFGVSKGDSFAVSKDAGLAAQLQGARQGNSTNAHCLEPGYVQVYATDGGGHLHTSFPGLTITAQTFTVMLHRGIVVPNTRSIWSYRWDNNSAGFDYYTSFANQNCLIQEERNALAAQNFPVNNPVSVSVCFVSCRSWHRTARHCPGWFWNARCAGCPGSTIPLWCLPKPCSGCARGSAGIADVLSCLTICTMPTTTRSAWSTT